MPTINKIKLHNFKKFRDLSLDVNNTLNVLIGDNESGKSSILTAIDLVLSGSRSKVETVGLDTIFNIQAVQDFLRQSKRIQDLPKLIVEVYLNDCNKPELNGKNNLEGIEIDGLRMICEPDLAFSKYIQDVLQQPEPNFPFEFYSINFRTFADSGYSGFNKYFRHVLVDTSQISNEYATREYIKAIYDSFVDSASKNKHQNDYRKYKNAFKSEVLKKINTGDDSYYFSLKSGSKFSLETDLTLSEKDVSIENKGKGRQCFIKTEFALSNKHSATKELDAVLIEEPENHLSHTNMKKLVRKISESKGNQIFIATHSDLISSRLDLTKSILLNSNSNAPVSFKKLNSETAKFFVKAPDNNVLQFVLSQKVILVEGDAEFILMEAFFKKALNNSPEDLDVHIISVDGKSFKRYLDVSSLLQMKKVAVITDNDGNYEMNCCDNYASYIKSNTQVFSDRDNKRFTFEVALYEDNKDLCDQLFGQTRRSLSVQQYMLNNKTETAFQLLDKKANEIVCPPYIQEAIKWISE